MSYPTQPMPPVPPENDPRNVPNTPSGARVNAGRLWAGGGATALVAALASVVGLMVCRVLDVPVYVSAGSGRWDIASTLPFALVCAGAALLATGLMHLLLIATPRPRLFFSWIAGLIAVILVVWPFTTSLSLEQKIASAAISLLITLVIASLVSASAARSSSVQG